MARRNHGRAAHRAGRRTACTHGAGRLWRIGALALCAAAALITVSETSGSTYWTSGRGSAAATVPALVATASTAAVTGLYPGSPPQIIPVTVRNAGAAAVTLAGLAVDVTASPASCPASGLTVTVPAPLPTIPASATATVSLIATVPIDAPDSCQGATFTLTITPRGPNA
ncbi:MAG: hypothetical protein JXA67_02940 [Micromonosporaceae bacterium]|nr:hypothetical protein [Micromonosporaceae bacterium]